jgi:polysaccharide biosynthesis/export protein
MKGSYHFLLTRTIALLITGTFVVLVPASADETETKAGVRQVAIKASSKDLGTSTRTTEPSAIVITQVRASHVGPHVQVSVVSGGNLFCTFFRLNGPNRLVLDCPGAKAQLEHTSIGVNLDPVRAVHIHQLKTDLVRVVIDLERESPYAIHTDARAITVFFDAMDRQALKIESVSARTGPAQAVKGERELTALTNVSGALDKFKLLEYSEASSASLIRAQADPLESIPLAPQSPTIVSSDPAISKETVGEANTPSEKLDSTASDQDYVIGPQDLLAINVWHEPELSESVPVRPDGKISLPLVGDLKVSGLTPRLLATRLAKELHGYIRKPQVTVMVREVNSHKFYILGQVERPGSYPLSTSMTVLDGLATAGGFRDFAKVQRIYLLRLMPDGSRKRFPFDYKAAVNGKNSYRDIELQTGDTLVVP